MFDFLKVKSEVEKAVGAIREARSKVEQLKRQREDLACAPATKADICRLMLAQVSEAAAEYPALLRNAIEHTTTCGKATMRDVQGRPTHVGIFTARQHMSHVPNVIDMQSSLCFILQSFTDEDGNSFLESAIRRAVDAMQWPEGAQPLEGREAALEKLDREIAQFEHDAAELRKSAAAAGVVI